MSKSYLKMNPQELEKIWNRAKEDAKKHPNRYQNHFPTLWEIGEMRRLKKDIENVIIIKKAPQKGFTANSPKRCEECNGEGKLLLASGYCVTKNGRTFSKVHKKWVTCSDCQGDGFNS